MILCAPKTLLYLLIKKHFLKHMKQRRLDTYSVDEDGDDFEVSILMLR